MSVHFDFAFHSFPHSISLSFSSFSLFLVFVYYFVKKSSSHSIYCFTHFESFTTKLCKIVKKDSPIVHSTPQIHKCIHGHVCIHQCSKSLFSVCSVFTVHVHTYTNTSCNSVHCAQFTFIKFSPLPPHPNLKQATTTKKMMMNKMYGNA